MWRLKVAVFVLAFAGACSTDEATGAAAAVDQTAAEQLAAQSEGPIDIAFSDHGYATAVRARVPVDGDPGAAALAFVQEHATLFGLDQDGYSALVAETTMLDGGDAIVTLQVDYQGVPIEGGLLGVAIQAGAIRFVESGIPFAPAQIETAPVVDESAAASTVASLYPTAPTAEAPVLVLADVGAMLGIEGSGPKLAWRIAVSEPTAETIFLSATTGTVVLRTPRELTGLTRTVRTAAGSPAYAEASRTGTIVATEAAGVTASGDPALLDTESDAAVAYAFVADGFDYFWDRFGWESYDGACAPLNLVVQINESAFSGANAVWNDDLEVIGFTPGSVMQDVTIHEYTHAVTDHVSIGSPRYQLESGAVHEALADSFASFATPEDGRWTFAEGFVEGGARSASNPTVCAYERCSPAHEEDFFQKADGLCDENGACAQGHVCRKGACVCVNSTSECDSGGVHFNSGILNHAIYLMAEGGEHATRGGPSIRGIGIEKTEQILFLAARLLMPNISFDGFREDMIWACQTLAEQTMNVPGAGVISAADCGSVINALAAVGIGPRDSDRDSWHDQVDICPDVPNPEQDREAICVNNPQQHCEALRYGVAYRQFKEGVDIGTPRSESDALLVTANCMMLNRDFWAAESAAVEGARVGSKGGRAANLYLAEFCAEKTGRADDAAEHRAASLEAGKSSGECAGAEGTALDGCAELQRTVALESFQRFLDENPK